MKISFPIILAAALAVLACSPRSRPANAPVITVTDDAGRNVALTAVPRRVASLAPSVTEMLYAIGCGGRVVGVTSWCNYPPEARQKPVIGDAVSFNAERLIALKPDLAVMVGTAQSPAVAKLEALGIPVIVLEPKSPDDIIKDLRLLGSALRCSLTADSLAASLQKSLNGIWIQTRLIEAQRPLVYAEIGINPLYTASNDSYIGQMISLAGGRNIAGRLIELNIATRRASQLIPR